MEFKSKDSSNSQPVEAKRVKVLILGSGPAGLTAALYTARANLEPVLLTGMELGGQVSLTFAVENYPGFPEGVGGQALVELFTKQAERFGAHIEFDTVTEVDLTRRPFTVRSYNTTYLADTLIITTGATPRHLNVPGETELTGRGTSYCATCDGWFFKDKDVVVVGGGDSALEEGLFLTRYAKTVTIVHRRQELRAGAILQKRATENPKMRFIFNSVVTRINGDEAVQSVTLKDVLTGEECVQPADGIFIFIGHDPNTQLFKGQLDIDEHGYIRTDTSTKTSLPGVFVAGEAGDPVFRQVITSAGMGAAAGMQAGKFLDDQEG
jgi:thioredoxin reductase (NADPH)